jgi:hypothetical protein
MPLHNWIECHEGNIDFCRKGNRGSVSKDLHYWTLLVDEHIKRFGLQESYKDFIQLKLDLANAQMDYVANQTRSTLNIVRRIEKKIQNILVNNGENLDVYDVLIYLSKFLGYKIDKYTLTVSEYFKMINIYTKANANTNSEK